MLSAGNNIDTQAHDTDLAAEYIFKAMALSGTEVLAPGISEITWGPENFSRVAKNANLQIVCANLPGFAPYAVLEKNNGRTKVLVTSVIDPALAAAGGSAQMLTDPVSALHQIDKEDIPHDLFVVIIQAGPEKIATIVEQCPDIDLVVDGTATESESQHPAGKRPAVVANNNQGMYVAYIDYDFGENGSPDFSKPVRIKAAVGKVDEDPGISGLVREYNTRRQAFLKQQTDPSGRVSTIETQAHAHYLGSESCRLCHPANNACWAKTQHAGAMESLSAMSRQNDPDCLYCHMTGMEKNTPPNMFTGTESSTMAGVQCEACHGPGRDHANDPQKSRMLSINENTCTRCHTKFRDPGFDFHQDLDKLNCRFCQQGEGTGCGTN